MSAMFYMDESNGFSAKLIVVGVGGVGVVCDGEGVGDGCVSS